MNYGRTVKVRKWLYLHHKAFFLLLSTFLNDFYEVGSTACLIRVMGCWEAVCGVRRPEFRGHIVVVYYDFLGVG